MGEENGIYLNGGDAAALLVHGLTGSPYELKYLAKRLNRAGYTVHAPCLAGHGKTTKELSKTRWEDWYRSVRESYRGLKSRYEKVCVAGLCMGALLSLMIASEEEDVAAISLLSTTLFYDGWSLPWYKFLLPLMYHPPFKYFYSYKESPPYGIKNERLRSIYLQGMRNGTLAYDSIPSGSMHELYKLIRESRKIMPGVRTPAVILHSAEDDLASSRNADYVEEHISSERVRKVLIPDSYHMITIDNNKDMVVDETIRFFDECVRDHNS